MSAKHCYNLSLQRNLRSPLTGDSKAFPFHPDAPRSWWKGGVCLCHKCDILILWLLCIALPCSNWSAEQKGCSVSCSGAAVRPVRCGVFLVLQVASPLVFSPLPAVYISSFVTLLFRICATVSFLSSWCLPLAPSACALGLYLGYHLQKLPEVWPCVWSLKFQ